MTARSRGLSELSEDQGQLVGRDAWSRVAYRDGDLTVLAIPTHADAPAFWCELHSVGQQVHEDLLDLPLICIDVTELRVQLLGQRDTTLRRARAQKSDGV